MGNETSSRKLFEKLDTDGDGDLALDELLEHAQRIPGLDENLLQLMKSPLLLFQFDEGEDGVLDREEFAQMMRSLRSYDRERKRKKKRDDDRHARRDRDHTGSKEKTRDGKRGRESHRGHRKRTSQHTSAPDSDESYSSKCWTALDSESAKTIDFSRDGATPSVTGRRRRASSSSSSSSEEDMSAEAREYLMRILSRKEHRKKFMRWLFKLTDVDNDQDVGPEELNKLLEGLQVDGVDPLSYERLDPRKTRAEQLLALYDTDGDGLLSKKDFMKLADLIMKQYEAKAKVPHKGERIGDLSLKHKLGKGAYSVVRLGLNQKTGGKFAVKIMQRGDMSNISKIDTEIKAMMMLKHPNVVQLHKVLENDTHVFFVMELCGGGTLSNYLEVKRLNESLARFYIKQLLLALKYCHKRGVCHRDLKVENLLLDNEGNLKLCDLGHAGIYSKGWDMFSTGLVGSMYHIAPEQISGQYYSGVKRDVWSVGVIAYQLLCGTPPFFDQNAQKLIASIQTAGYAFPDYLSDEVKDLIGRILKVDPEERPSLSYILKHSWFDGEVQTPAIIHFTYRLDLWHGEPDSSMRAPFKQMVKICEALNVHVVMQEPKKSHYLSLAKCVYPSKEVTFTLAMKKRDLEHARQAGSKPFRYATSSADAPVRYFEFLLRKGEAWDFSELVLSIRKRFSRWQRTVRRSDVGGSHRARVRSKSPEEPSMERAKQSKAESKKASPRSASSAEEEEADEGYLNIEREEFEVSQTEDDDDLPVNKSVNFHGAASIEHVVELSHSSRIGRVNVHSSSRSPPKSKPQSRPLSSSPTEATAKMAKTPKALKSPKSRRKVKDKDIKPVKRTLNYSAIPPSSPKRSARPKKNLGDSLSIADVDRPSTLEPKDKKSGRKSQTPMSPRRSPGKKKGEIDKDKIAEQLESLTDWDFGELTFGQNTDIAVPVDKGKRDREREMKKPPKKRDRVGTKAGSPPGEYRETAHSYPSQSPIGKGKDFRKKKKKKDKVLPSDNRDSGEFWEVSSPTAGEKKKKKAPGGDVGPEKSDSAIGLKKKKKTPSGEWIVSSSIGIEGKKAHEKKKKPPSGEWVLSTSLGGVETNRTELRGRKKTQEKGDRAFSALSTRDAPGRPAEKKKKKKDRDKPKKRKDGYRERDGDSDSSSEASSSSEEFRAKKTSSGGGKRVVKKLAAEEAEGASCSESSDEDGRAKRKSRNDRTSERLREKRVDMEQDRATGQQRGSKKKERKSHSQSEEGASQHSTEVEHSTEVRDEFAWRRRLAPSALPKEEPALSDNASEDPFFAPTAAPVGTTNLTVSSFRNVRASSDYLSGAASCGSDSVEDDQSAREKVVPG